MKEFGIALVGGLTAALIGVAAQYFIAYELIEEPKILIEKKKISIEAQKQMALLAPIFDTECTSRIFDKLTWHISCLSKNSGQYTSEVSITNVDLVGSAERENVIYKEGDGFTTSYPQNKKGNKSFPTSKSNLDFYLNLDAKNFPLGIRRKDLIARVSFKYTTSDSIIKFFSNDFPEMQEALADNTTRYMQVYVALPATNIETNNADDVVLSPVIK